MTDRSRTLAGVLAGALCGLGLGTARIPLAAPAARAQQEVPQILRAHEFQVVDKEGNARIKLAVADNGTAVVQVQGKQAGPMLSLGVTADDAAALVIRDKKGNARLTLDYTKDMGSSLTFFDDAQRPAVSLLLTDAGDEAVTLAGEPGSPTKNVLMLNVEPGQKPRIGLVSSSGKLREISP